MQQCCNCQGHAAISFFCSFSPILEEYAVTRNLSLFFRCFLVLYLGSLFLHLSHLDWSAAGTLIGFIIGLLVAFFAHQKNGTLALVLLLVHMSVEWHGHALHHAHYTPKEVWLYGIHAFFDLAFLFFITKECFGAYAQLVSLPLIGYLALLTWLTIPSQEQGASTLQSFTETRITLPHDHSSPHSIEQLLLGGMIGCVIAHLLSKRR